MKKIEKLVVGFIVCCLAIISLTGCGNRQMFDTTWNFNRVYLIVGDETFELEIDSWRDFDGSDMIQFRTTDGRTYLTHSTNIILIQD